MKSEQFAIVHTNTGKGSSGTAGQQLLSKPSGKSLSINNPDEEEDVDLANVEFRDEDRGSEIYPKDEQLPDFSLRTKNTLNGPRVTIGNQSSI